MKRYGCNKSTEFTKKQVNVIWAKAKHGELKIEKWFMSELYDLADYYGYDDNGSVAENEATVLEILEAVFSNEIEKAQALIDEATDSWYSRKGRKMQEKCNRSMYVA